MRLGRRVPFTLRSWRNGRSVPAGYKVVAVVVMRENESAMANKVEDVHSIYRKDDRRREYAKCPFGSAPALRG